MRILPMVVVALATLMNAAPARAQLIPGPGGFGGGRRYSPIVSARAGWSIRDSSPSLGAEVRLPIPIAVIRPSITPGGDLVFQSGLVERQGMLDVTFGVFQPIYFGGGPVALNSVFDDSSSRQTKGGYTLVVGFRGGRAGRLQTDLGFRYMNVSDLHPRFFTLALGYPLLDLIGR